MKTTKTKHELRLLAVTIVGAFLVIFGHLILAKSFADLPWTEATAAAIPLILLMLSVGSVYYAVKSEDEDKTEAE
ncbi:hypothetical protein QWZ04_00225 [Vibrio tapetis subsp. quintayensis]|uniref:hypothetical protein n=1 Tax=Vibrio tapetis TaxID=52443 RepID=UPI0025B52C80|nr:hypothetical protein [Vibrio tapetis]MDN3678771.1 hypothetical protein [Vibrio tapetis subsp. quintayensis]